jgi:hypothetical protein
MGNPYPVTAEFNKMSDLNFDFLKGKELGLLCFGPYTVTFHFGDETNLQVESEIRHTTFDSGESTKKYHFPISESRLTRLLMQTVETVKVAKNGKLTLSFSNNDILEIEGRIGPYEAYNLGYQGKSFIV